MPPLRFHIPLKNIVQFVLPAFCEEGNNFVVKTERDAPPCTCCPVRQHDAEAGASPPPVHLRPAVLQGDNAVEDGLFRAAFFAV